jgi:hypothetical protein
MLTTMSSSNNTDPWTHLSQDAVLRRLESIGLILCRVDSVIICICCKYALQPYGQTVSKHLWEKHSIPAKDRAGLNDYVRTLGFQDPNTIPTSRDGSPPHPHLIIHSGATCLQCDYRTTSTNLLQRYLAKDHGQKKGQTDTDGRGIRAEVNLQSWSQNGQRKSWIVTSYQENKAP